MLAAPIDTTFNFYHSFYQAYLLMLETLLEAARAIKSRYATFSFCFIHVKNSQSQLLLAHIINIFHFSH